MIYIPALYLLGGSRSYTHNISRYYRARADRCMRADCSRLILHQSIFNRARPRVYLESGCGEMHINRTSRRESRKRQIKVRAPCNKAILHMIYLPSACAQIQPKLNFYCLLCYLNRRARCSKGCWRQRAPPFGGGSGKENLPIFPKISNFFIHLVL